MMTLTPFPEDSRESIGGSLKRAKTKSGFLRNDGVSGQP